MELLDYKVRVLEGSQGTGAVVRVLIESGDGEERWSTVGASTNILEASWQALTDSFAYFLLFRIGVPAPEAAVQGDLGIRRGPRGCRARAIPRVRIRWCSAATGWPGPLLPVGLACGPGKKGCVQAAPAKPNRRDARCTAPAKPNRRDAHGTAPAKPNRRDGLGAAPARPVAKWNRPRHNRRGRFLFIMVQMGRLELPPGVVTRHGPEPCASANSATSAGCPPSDPAVRCCLPALTRFRRVASGLVEPRGVEPLTS